VRGSPRERRSAWPQALPGGEALLFTVRAFARYSPTGHLLFVRGGALFAVPFDLKGERVTGPEVVIAQQVAVDPWVGGAHYAVAVDGTVLFFRGRFLEPERRLVWVGRDGQVVASGVSGTRPSQPRISPDGTRGVFTAMSADGDNEVLLADLARGTSVRFSADPRDDFTPVWTHDGRAVIWTALQPARAPILVTRAADGSGRTEEVLPETKGAQFAGSVSPSGVLAYTVALGETVATDIWVVPLSGPREPRALVATSASEFGPEFSPDGNWIAYVSDESGAYEIYVVP
jgi:hypothetical protein